MLISCPSCAATYDVPEHLLSAQGQMLRCSRCVHEWMVMPPPPPVVSEHVPLSPSLYPEPPDLESREAASVMPALTGRGKVRPPQPPVEPVALAMAWVLTVFVIVSLGWGAVRWRGEVMEAWPPSQRAYSALGLR